nr:hypothetical protein CFP56_57959 [Quercus suber]
MSTTPVPIDMYSSCTVPRLVALQRDCRPPPHAYECLTSTSGAAAASPWSSGVKSPFVKCDEGERRLRSICRQRTSGLVLQSTLLTEICSAPFRLVLDKTLSIRVFARHQ